MAHFDLSTYETVEQRLVKFWELYPNGRVHTDIVHYDDKRVLIKAFLYKDINDVNSCSTGFAEEVFGSSPVNKTSFVENCETSAIGRATANMNLSAKGKRASREEMAKVERRTAEQAQPVRTTGQFAKPKEKAINPQALTKAQGEWVMRQLEQKYEGEEPMTRLSDLVGHSVIGLEDIQPDDVRVLIQKLAGKE